MVEGSKQVRVDNWGIFFLQRLQMFFSKTDYCDLTLQFEGNVQLKVHRLVMNACTEYFNYLEQTCPALEESTIIMPADLQADVIVPIVNFMYTGMLEFHMSIFERLYKAAELMDITVLTKLLDAQKVPMQLNRQPKKKTEANHSWNLLNKKATAKTANTPELPPTLPGRKLPVWKRKNVPVVPIQHPSSQMHYTPSEPKWAQDPLMVPDNTPKPTRFEWPDEDLPPINLMDTSFEEISYTSKPLLTQEEEIRASTSFEDVKNNVSNQPKKSVARTSSGNINIKEVENYVKEQRIRTELSSLERGEDEYVEYEPKRKLDQNAEKSSPKRLKVSDKENKETMISIKSANMAELDHTKIVSEILKKYPQLVRRNKNIRLKIMGSGNKIEREEKVAIPVKPSSVKVQEEVASKSKAAKPAQKPKETEKFSEDGPWSCSKCKVPGEPVQEFVLYYLYRKHMTDVHNEMFDLRLCKYCGRRCGKHNLMMYHLYTKHGLKPPASYNFPKCDQCPYIALSLQKIMKHKLQHNPNEMQCLDCKLAFTSQQTLAAHIQITGHPNKAGRPSSYDCQYCTKKLQSAINLFSHIKNSHIKEARRDGIVSLDETDDVDDMDKEPEEDEEEEGEEEYIVPEILPDVAVQKDKVKIISNVKVPVRSEQGTGDSQQQTLPLEPSSEAEALSNVASGIATSLGLVDIVVLDENQQYILQQQENQSGQPEFILPELSSGENPFSGQVITTQHSAVIPQGMLQSTGSDIGSTDELVMVLTDHDYQDDQGGGPADNSNIVVLYSHPVDGQQGQFITSQGNLLVNSQTGMLEIRNGATIATTTANQIVVNSATDTPIESIEMIRREIESHNELKQEPFYEEDRKPDVQVHQDQQASENINNQPEELPCQETSEHIENDQENPQDNSETLEENTRITAAPEEGKEIPQEDAASEESTKVAQENVTSEENHAVHNAEQEKEDKGEAQDKVDGPEESFEEPMEIDEEQLVHENATNEAELTSSQTFVAVPETASLEKDLEQHPEPPPEEVIGDEEEKGKDVPPDAANVSTTIHIYETSETLVINDPSHLYDSNTEESEDRTDEKDNSAEDKNDASEPMEVDGKAEEHEQEEEEERCPEKNEREVENQSEECGDSQKEQGNENEEGNETTTPEIQVQQEVHQEISEPATEDQEQTKASNSEFNEDEDENSHSSQDTTQSQENTQDNKNQSNINQAILEDWEDTDSQQSEKQRVAMKKAAENVNKLMDDWEEEDDDEEKKEAD